jgi:hypothetical protein
METKYVSTVQGGLFQNLKQGLANVFKSLSLMDYLFALALLAGAIFAEVSFSSFHG